MTTLEIVFGIISLGVTGFSVWYIRKMILFLRGLKDEIQGLATDLSTFAEHLESIYGMEMFYGDTTLKGILDHVSYIKEASLKSAETLNEMILENNDHEEKEE